MFSYLTSNYENLSCLIFDEIDTGVSGETADLMSEMMKDISQYRQVISVTHLPQIEFKSRVPNLKYTKKNFPIELSLK